MSIEEWGKAYPKILEAQKKFKEELEKEDNKDFLVKTSSMRQDWQLPIDENESSR